MTVVINREGGAASAAGAQLSGQVVQAFADAGARAEVQMLAARDIDAAIGRAAARRDRIAVAGGDGTIAAAAQLLTGSDVELAVLPLGTLNHFARDLGIPTDLAEAARLAVQGRAKPVDVGEVNGRRFINNASVGLYPFMVRNRDDLRERHGLPKWLASVPAAWRALSRLRNHRLSIDRGTGDKPVITPLLFIGNNHYSLERGSVGTRDSLSEGVLSVYAVAQTSRAALLGFGLRAVLGFADRAHDFDELGDCTALSVQSSERRVEIALDGEVQRLSLPLDFTIRAGGLRVVVPERRP